jgi:hypothetical protein
MDTCPAYRAAAGSQGNPAIAFDGENFLLVWQDTRDAYYSDIYGARVTPAGALLDPTGFSIAVAQKQQELPAVACAESVFLVVWEDRRNGFYQDIYAARVTLAGVVLDTAGIVVSTAEDYQLHPAVAWDGSSFLVVWGDCRTGSYDVYGARITTAGMMLDSAGFVISSAVRYQQTPALAFDGSNYLVAWVDTRSGTNADVYGTRVTPAGQVLDTEGIPVCSSAGLQHDPSVSFDGTNCLVVWDDSRNGNDDDIYGARVTPSGSVLDPEGIAVSQAAGHQYYPAVAFDGTNFLAVWHENNSAETYGARITPEGEVLDTAGIRVAGPIVRGHPTAAFGGADFLVAWTDTRSTYDIYGARVTPAGTVLDPSGIILSTAANPQSSPVVASDSNNFLAVWEDERSLLVPDIYAARVSPQGVLLDSLSIAVSTAANQQVSPAVAYDGANYLVVWQDGRSGSYDIYGARLTPAGVLLESLGFVVSQAYGHQESPAVAYDGASFLVVWIDGRNGPSYEEDIYGARVTPEGAVLDTQGILITGAAGRQYSPAVAFDGTDFLAVWEDWRGSACDVYGARVSPSGRVLDTSGIPISGAEYGQNSPAIASDGANSLVVWVDERNYSVEIYGARVTPSGVVLDSLGIPVTADTNTEYSPAVSFDGVQFCVSWSGSPSDPESDIYGARVTPGGAVLDHFVMVAQDGSQRYPSVASGAGNQLLLVYQGWAGRINGTAYNTDRTWGKLGPFTGIQEYVPVSAGSRWLAATIVHGVLRVPVSSFTIHTSLFDMTGRQVADLHAGTNDVSGLAPGVYFVREESQAAGPKLQAVRKVVVAR